VLDCIPEEPQDVVISAEICEVLECEVDGAGEGPGAAQFA
jgi:hypothetical protein